MAEPLRVGLAGLGTVGSAVASMLARSQAVLAERAGRGIVLAAYASKDPPKDLSLDLSKARKIDDPIALARDAGIDVLVEVMGGSGDPAKSTVEAGARCEPERRHRQQGAPRQAWACARQARRGA
jgi:homoserine dehydrogenase